LANAPGRLRHDLRLHLLTQLRRGQMTAQPFLGFFERDRLGQRPGNAAQFAILAGSDAQKHLLNEFGFGFGKVGGNYPRKLMNLGAQFFGHFGSVHGGLRVLVVLPQNITNSALAAETSFPLVFWANKLAIRYLQKNCPENWG
jgi:hypothetical protein